MGLFSTKPYLDPELGELKRVQGRWRGNLTVPNQGIKPLALAGDRQRPDEENLSLARQIPRRYAALLSDIQPALYAHYEAGFDDQITSKPASAMHNDMSLWGHVGVEGILIEPLAGVPTIEIALRTEWDEEHTLGARIQEWKFVELNGSILSVF